MADTDRIKRNIRKMIDMGAPETEIDGYIQSEGVTLEQLRGPATRDASAPSARDTLRDATVGVSQGVTANFGDELFAGLLTPVEMAKRAITGEDAGKGFMDRVGDSYTSNLARERGELATAQERSPVASTLGNVAGGLATGGQLSKGGLSLLNGAKPTLTSMAGRGAAEGAIYGGLYGAGAGEGAGDRLAKAASGATIGAVTGGAAGAIGARSAAKSAKAAIPSTDDLKSAANAAYGAADDAGVVIKPQKFDGLLSDIDTMLQNEGFRPKLAPRVAVAVEELGTAKGTPLRLKDVDMLRRVARTAAQSNDPAERRLGAMVIEKIDDWTDNIVQSDVIAGNATQAVKSLTDARKYWTMTRKSEIIDGIMERAKTNAPNFSASGYENALRTEFRNLSKNAKLMRGFTSAEKSAILKVARGGPVENLLRQIGKFSPRGVVSSALGGGVGYGIGGPIGALAVMGAGETGRRAATAMTAANANRVSDLIRSGGNIPQAQAIPQATRGLLEAIIQGTAQQGNRVPLTEVLP